MTFGQNSQLIPN